MSLAYALGATVTGSASVVVPPANVPGWLKLYLDPDGTLNPVIATSLRAAPFDETPAQKAANLAQWPRIDKYSTPSSDPSCITDWNVFNALNALNPACGQYYHPQPGRPCDTSMDCPRIAGSGPATPIPQTAATEGSLNTSTGVLTLPDGTPVQYLPPPPAAAAAGASATPTATAAAASVDASWFSSGTAIFGFQIPNIALAAGGALLLLLLLKGKHKG